MSGIDGPIRSHIGRIKSDQINQGGGPKHAPSFNVDNFMESAAILKKNARHYEVIKKYGPTPSLTEARRTRTMHPGLPHSKGWMRNLLCPCESGKKFKHCHM